MSSCDCAGMASGWAERSVSALPTWDHRYRYGPAVRLTVRFPGQYSRQHPIGHRDRDFDPDSIRITWKPTT